MSNIFVPSRTYHLVTPFIFLLNKWGWTPLRLNFTWGYSPNSIYYALSWFANDRTPCEMLSLLKASFYATHPIQRLNTIFDLTLSASRDITSKWPITKLSKIEFLFRNQNFHFQTLAPTEIEKSLQAVINFLGLAFQNYMKIV